VATSLAHLVAIVPVGLLEGAKSRLGEPLDAEERRGLVLTLLDRTVRAALTAETVEIVVVVSPDAEVLRAASAAGATPIRQPGRGLNEALILAARWAGAAGASAILVLPADLPAISPNEVDRFERAAAASLDPARSLVALVPDARGEGTNALLVAPPGAIGFSFGPGSCRLHRAAAEAAEAALAVIGGPLELDLDLPEDFLQAETLGLLEPADAG
jgi:2-phospho-L-lactate guanylyltransferase